LPEGGIAAVAERLTMATSPDTLLRISRARRQVSCACNGADPATRRRLRLRRGKQPPATLVQGGGKDANQARLGAGSIIPQPTA
jgi:hypothetical protein